MECALHTLATFNVSMPKRCGCASSKTRKLTSTRLKDQRHIVLLPLITLLVERICQQRLEKLYAGLPGHTTQCGFQPKKGTRKHYM